MPGGGEREREEEEESERAISPIFRFLGKKWPPFHSIARPSSVVSQLLQNCIIHLTLERRRTDDMCGRAKTRIGREKDMSLLAGDGDNRNEIESSFGHNNQRLLKQSPWFRSLRRIFQIELAETPDGRGRGHMHLIMQPKGRDR